MWKEIFFHENEPTGFVFRGRKEKKSFCFLFEQFQFFKIFGKKKIDNEDFILVIKQFLPKFLTWITVYTLGYFNFSIAWLTTPLLLIFLRINCMYYVYTYIFVIKLERKCPNYQKYLRVTLKQKNSMSYWTSIENFGQKVCQSSADLTSTKTTLLG